MKRVLIAIKFFLCTLLVAISPFLLRAGEPPKNSNWDNSMSVLDNGGSHGDEICVNLDEDNIVNIKIRLDFSSTAIDQLPPIFIQYAFYINNVQVLSALTPQITSNMLVGVPDPKGFARYRAAFDLPFNCDSYCPEPPYSEQYNFDFKLEYQVVTPNPFSTPTQWLPYRYGGYPNVWNPNQFDVQPDPLFSFSKHICCWNGLLITKWDDGNKFDVANGESFDNPAPDLHHSQNSSFGQNPADAPNRPLEDLAGQISVSPNPFNDIVNVKLDLVRPSEVLFECLDAQGKVVRSSRTQYGTSGIYNKQLDLGSMPQGLYYLRIRHDNKVFSTKLIKMGE